MTPWLYYQVGVLALELDVWGIPKPKKEAAGDEPLTLDRLEKMSSEEFLALSETTVASFLLQIGAPPQMTAERLMERVRSGQATPEQMAKMARRFGAGKAAGAGEDDDKANERELAILKWLEEHDPEALVPWTPVTLSDGTAAEVGGRDAFAELAPPMEALNPALEVHTQTVLDLAGQLARLEIVSLEVIDLGGSVHRVEATVANRGSLATHTKMAARARARLPVRLEIETGAEVALLTGRRFQLAERLEGQTGVVEAEWLVKTRPGATVTVRAISENAGQAVKTLTVAKGDSR